MFLVSFSLSLSLSLCVMYNSNPSGSPFLLSLKDPQRSSTVLLNVMKSSYAQCIHIQWTMTIFIIDLVWSHSCRRTFKNALQAPKTNIKRMSSSSGNEERRKNQLQIIFKKKKVWTYVVDRWCKHLLSSYLLCIDHHHNFSVQRKERERKGPHTSTCSLANKDEYICICICTHAPTSFMYVVLFIDI